jgi:trans-aconitate methyltransferase
MTGSWDRSVFDRIYARAEDPWDFAGSPYEIAKYRETLAALPNRRFSRGLEVGCSIGVQTRLLAERCDWLLALDLAPEAIRRASARCADLPQVELRQAQVPQDWPADAFDLIVLSEVLYFLDPADIATLGRRVLGCTGRGAVVVLVNWTGETDTPTTGREAAELFIGAVAPHFAMCMQNSQETYRLDVLQRVADTGT